MTDIQLLAAYMLHPDNRKDQVLSHQTITDSAVSILSMRKEHRHTVRYNYDADLVFQMITVKALSVCQMASGINYSHPEKAWVTDGLLDPQSIFAVVRTQFEAYCNFNNIYINSKSVEEIQLKHDIWAVAGLLNRQKFDVGNFKEFANKKSKEKEEIDELKMAIESNTIFKALDEDSKKQIRNWKRLANDWKIVFNGNQAQFVSWKTLMANSGATDLFDTSYVMLSLNTHPSYVSVFQFDQLYKNGQAEFATKIALSFSKWLMCFCIWDFINYADITTPALQRIPLLDQTIIKLCNSQMRKNHKYSSQ